MRSLKSVAALGAALSAGLLLATPVWPQDGDYGPETIVATVNGEEITLGHVIALVNRLPQEYQGLPDDQLYQGMIDQLVQQTLLAQSVSASPDSDPLDVRLFTQNERRGALAGKVVAEVFGQAPSDEDVQARYDRFASEFRSEPEYNAAHILVGSEEEAAAALAEIESGAEFGEIAQQRSTDGSAQNGGGLGWFGRGQMVPAFEEAVIALKPGEIGGPIQTQFGWHLIKLDEMRDTKPPQLEQIRDQIVAELSQGALVDRVDALRAEAEIEMGGAEIPANAIRRSELLDQ